MAGRALAGGALNAYQLLRYTTLLETPAGFGGARPEEGVSISADGSDGEQSFRADVAVKEPWQTPPMTERWIEIRDSTGRLITVIEILSPANKNGGDWHDYFAKRRTLLDYKRPPDLPLSAADQEWLVGRIDA